MKKTVKQYSEVERRLMKEYFQSKGITKYQFSPADGYDQWDGKFVDGQDQIIFDVKVRNIPSTMYNTTIINESKYDFLTKYTEDTNVKPYIFVFFTDGKVFVKNLKRVKKNIVEKTADKVTAEPEKGKKVHRYCEIYIDELSLINY